MLVLSLIPLVIFKLVKLLWPKPADRLTIAGPAGVHYDSVHEAAEDYIQNWLPDWRTKHYMLPPVFEYKFTEPCGRASGAVKGVGPDCEDRSMDKVFHAVDKFMTDHGIPGVVFHSFTMKNREKLLEKFLPFMTGPDWIDQYADIECDLLIVSPKMGFVAFEVKGTQSPRLSTVKKALKQAAVGQASAKLIRPFLGVVLQHAGVNTSDVPVRRVVALPFKNRERLASSSQPFSQLLADLEAGSDVDGCLFGEDFFGPRRAANDGLFSCLNQFLIPQVDSQTLVQSVSAKLLHTLITIWALRLTGSDCRLDHSAASETHAIAKTDDKIKGQKLWERKKKRRDINARSVKNKNDGPKTTIIPCSADVVMTHSVNRIFFVTPEQQKVLDGPRIQLIHGPAGSGKSVLIMIKAAQLVKNGQCVAICSSFSMMHNYKLWKERNGFSDKQCKIHDLLYIETDMKSLKRESAYDQTKIAINALTEELRKCRIQSPNQSCHAEVKRILSELPKPERSNGSTAPKTPFSERSVFLDDACFSSYSHIDQYALLYLAFDKTYVHHLWIAIDALQCSVLLDASYAWRYFYNAVSLVALALGELPSEEAGTLSVLRSVQRCSTHVFNAWFDLCNDIMAQHGNWSFAKELYRGVVPGHHIVGPAVIKQPAEEVEDAVKYVSDEVSNLLKGGTRPRHIAVLCDSVRRRNLIQELLEKKSTSVAYCDIEDQLNGTDAVAVDNCYNAVSLEWPIVFVVWPSSTGWPEDLPMAMSRARTKLTVVEVMDNVDSSDLVLSLNL